MRIKKINTSSIQFDNGGAIKIAPHPMHIDVDKIRLNQRAMTREFSENLIFTDRNGVGFSFGNEGEEPIPVSVLSNGACRECAIYYENKLKLVVEIE